MPPELPQPATLPSVTVHYGQTLDGRIATRAGHSQWISGAGGLLYAHQLRAAHDAVLVGIGTVLADNPRLTVRLCAGRSPLRVVADSCLRIPAAVHLLTDGAAPTLIATTTAAPPERIAQLRAGGTDVIVLAADAEGRVDLPALLACLGARGVRTLMIEGGGGIITSALRARLVDRLTVCIAPKVVGAGIEAVNDLQIRRMSDALTFREASFTPLGEDILFDGLLERAAPAASCEADGSPAG